MSLWVQRVAPYGLIKSIACDGRVLEYRQAAGEWWITRQLPDGWLASAPAKEGDMLSLEAVELAASISQELECSLEAAFNLVEEAVGPLDPMPFGKEELMAG